MSQDVKTATEWWFDPENHLSNCSLLAEGFCPASVDGFCIGAIDGAGRHHGTGKCHG
jgi:hypothetical protein